MERFAQLIPLNIQEIFTWYFEQKGVENPERFLGVNQTGAGVNGTGVNNNSSALATPNGFPEGTVVGVNGVNGVNENELNADSQAGAEQPLQELPQEIAEESLEEKPQSFQTEQLLSLLNKIMDKVNSNKKEDKNPLEMLTALKKLRKEI